MRMPAASNTPTATADTLRLIEDVEFLLSWHTQPEQISERLGYRHDTLIRRLERNGRRDLARKLERKRWAA